MNEGNVSYICNGNHIVQTTPLPPIKNFVRPQPTKDGVEGPLNPQHFIVLEIRISDTRNRNLRLRCMDQGGFPDLTRSHTPKQENGDMDNAGREKP